MYQPEPTTPKTGWSRGKKIGAVIVACLIVILIASIFSGKKDKTNASANPPTAPVVRNSAPATVSHSEPATSREQVADEAFLQVVRQEIPAMKNASDQTLIIEGQSLCGMLDDGATLPIVAQSVMHDGKLGVADAGFFVGAAVAAYCPQHQDILSGGSEPTT